MTKTVTWCDRCGEETEAVTRIRVGDPTKYYDSSTDSKYTHELCPTCLSGLKGYLAATKK